MALVLKSMSPVSETPRRWRSHLMAGKTRPTNQLSGKSLNMHEGKKNRQNHYNGFCQLCKRIVHFFILNWVVLSPFPFWFWFRSPFLFVWSDTRLTGHHRQVVYILFIFFTHVCSDLRTAARLYMVAFCQHFLRKFNHESNTNFYEWSVFIMIRWNNFFDTIFSQLYLSSGINQDRTQVYPKSCWIRKKTTPFVENTNRSPWRSYSVTRRVWRRPQSGTRPPRIRMRRLLSRPSSPWSPSHKRRSQPCLKCPNPMKPTTTRS